MAKSTIFLWFVVTVAVAALLGVIALGEETPTQAPSPSAPSQVAVAVSSSGDAGAALASFEASQETRAEQTQSALALLPEQQAVARWLNPSLAVRPRFPAPRPDHPPEPFPTLERPEPTKLEAEAKAQLNTIVSNYSKTRAPLLGVGLFLVDGGATTRTLTSASLDGHASLSALSGWVAKADTEAISGLLVQDGAVFAVSASRTPAAGGMLWAVSLSSLDEAALDGFAATLGQAGSVSLVMGGAAVVTSKGAPAEAASVGQDAKPGEAGAAQDVGVGTAKASAAALGVTVVAGDSDVAAWVVMTPPVEGSAATTVKAKPAPVTAPPALEGLVDRIKASPVLSDPSAHLPVLLGLVGAMLLLTLLGWALMRSENLSRWKSVAAHLQGTDPVDDIPLYVHERSLVTAALGRVPAPPPAPPAPPAPTHSDEEVRDLQNDNHRLKNNLESAQGSIEQSQRQLQYARQRIGEVEKERDQASQVQRQLRVEVTNLQGQVTKLGRAVADAEVAARQAQAHPQSVAASQPASRPMPPKPKKDYDTEEVSNEDMSQLLEGLDLEGSMDGSLTAMAQQIDAMSREQAQAHTAQLPTGPASAPTPAVRRSQDPSKITATGLPNLSKNIPHFPTPHQPIKESDIWASRNDTAPELNPVSRVTEPFDEDRTIEGSLGAEFANALASATRGSNSRQSSSAASPSKALSPAGLLEALKRRGQQETTEDSMSQIDPSTRVAPIAEELLQQSRPVERPQTLSHSGTFRITGSRADGEPATDSEYFKTLYEEFLDTKRRCGERTDNITLDRFVNRLARNKQALVDRYNCRTVRFQVYVKDGRAALKATPVK